MAVVHEPHFGAARDLFALYCKAKGLSVRTLQTYPASIDELGTSLAQSGRGGGIPFRVVCRNQVIEPRWAYAPRRAHASPFDTPTRSRTGSWYGSLFRSTQ